MSNKHLIIEERARDIGDFLVGRLLPFRKKRMVGPFCFIDHMGPTILKDGKYMDVGQHPHIGLSTLTYLFEGEIEHRDSIGTIQRITPGSVNCMTAGHGVTHTERTPIDLRDGRELKAHGFQIWVALPDGQEEMEPEFQHIAANDIPEWRDQGIQWRLVAGEAFDRKSPLKVYLPMFMLEAHCERNTQIDLAGQLKGEIGICVVDGEVTACDETIRKGNLLVAKAEDACKLGVSAGSHLLFFGGEPFENERHIWWNFVSSSKDKIEEAKARWAAKELPMVEGDDSYIGLPKR